MCFVPIEAKLKDVYWNLNNNISITVIEWTKNLKPINFSKACILLTEISWWMLWISLVFEPKPIQEIPYARWLWWFQSRFVHVAGSNVYWWIGVIKVLTWQVKPVIGREKVRNMLELDTIQQQKTINMSLILLKMKRSLLNG